jgi:hypothetical protein
MLRSVLLLVISEPILDSKEGKDSEHQRNQQEKTGSGVSDSKKIKKKYLSYQQTNRDEIETDSDWSYCSTGGIKK